MQTCAIAIGNTLRCDDGVAYHVAAQLQGVDVRYVQQLNPELAAGIADFHSVIFIDAAVDAPEITIEPLAQPAAPVTIAHVSSPENIVALSRSLFCFAGEAFVCRIPAQDFSFSQNLSPEARASADLAVAKLNNFLNQRTNSLV
jgi:hydrogenase maturation protease